MNTNVSRWRTAVAVIMGGAMLVTMTTESTAGSPPASGDAASIKAVQQALKDKGHDPGAVDGKMGPKTQAALRDYQQKEGLKATGRLDTETASKLGVQAKADTSSSGSPAASPSGSSSSPSGSSSSGSSSTGSGADTKAGGSSSTGGAAKDKK
jgi:peptidoglycan hydrolase-like protein with peptidoglycan-binding domain